MCCLMGRGAFPTDHLRGMFDSWGVVLRYFLAFFEVLSCCKGLGVQGGVRGHGRGGRAGKGRKEVQGGVRGDDGIQGAQRVR